MAEMEGMHMFVFLERLNASRLLEHKHLVYRDHIMQQPKEPKNEVSLLVSKSKLVFFLLKRFACVVFYFYIDKLPGDCLRGLADETHQQAVLLVPTLIEQLALPISL